MVGGYPHNPADPLYFHYERKEERDMPINMTNVACAPSPEQILREKIDVIIDIAQECEKYSFDISDRVFGCCQTSGSTGSPHDSNTVDGKLGGIREIMCNTRERLSELCGKL
jgi:hypothetical protein